MCLKISLIFTDIVTIHFQQYYCSQYNQNPSQNHLSACLEKENSHHISTGQYIITYIRNSAKYKYGQ